MSEESDEASIDSVDDELPVIEEGSDTMEVGVVEEEKDPLEEKNTSTNLKFLQME